MVNHTFLKSQKNFGAIIALAVIAVVSCNGFVQTSKSSNFVVDHKGLSVRGGQTKLSLPADIPELRPPKSMYANVVELGAMKASLSPLKTFILGILSGCHIAFGKSNYVSHFQLLRKVKFITFSPPTGAFLVLTVGGACPGLAESNPGLQKIISGAFGLPFGKQRIQTGHDNTICHCCYTFP